MLATYIPYLEVDGRIWGREGDGGDVLTNRGDGLEVGIVRGVVRFDAFEEGRFTRVVEP